jgi:hypothetical protein
MFAPLLARASERASGEGYQNQSLFLTSFVFLELEVGSLEFAMDVSWSAVSRGCSDLFLLRCIYVLRAVAFAVYCDMS